jgi:uncharacterized Zn finger protein (UPF0148 family)
MTIPAIGWDTKIEEYMDTMQGNVKAKLEHCSVCGWPFYQHSGYQSDKCLECSGTHNTYNREKRRQQQKNYARKRVRVAKDRRRKEFRNESRPEVQ